MIENFPGRNSPVCGGTAPVPMSGIPGRLHDELCVTRESFGSYDGCGDRGRVIRNDAMRAIMTGWRMR
jgi:hypothetical protein